MILWLFPLQARAADDAHGGLADLLWPSVNLLILLFSFVTMFLLFVILKKAGMLRVSREHELAGLDISEHGEIEGESY